jgi:phosphohistidine phosphatase SixA
MAISRHTLWCALLAFTLLTAAAFKTAAFASEAKPSDVAPEETRAWNALKQGGHIVLMRHAQTVAGTGDPPNFKLSECATQRNLNELGRAQSRAWGQAFATRQIPLAGAYSSQWCRCVDTAKIAFAPLTRVETWPALNSHFDTPQTGGIQAEQVRGGIGVRMKPGRNIVLVTHQVNITELTGRAPAMGDAVVLRWDATKKAMQFVGTLPVPTTGVANPPR